MRTIYKTILLCILNFYFNSISACDCEFLYKYDNSKEVFIGFVEKVEIIEGESSYLATLKVKEIYKEFALKHRRYVNVRSVADECGYKWEIGYYYLIFVEKVDRGVRYVSACTLTEPIKNSLGKNGTSFIKPTLSEVENWNLDNEIYKKWTVIIK